MLYRQIAYLFIIASIFCSCGSNTPSATEDATTEAATVETENDADHNILTAEETAAGWTLLFDGQSTNGWRNYGKNAVEGWTVKDGELIAAGGVGDIMTEKEFENYELSLEWKISVGGNSGIIYNVVEDTVKYKSTYATGPEYQIIDADGYKDKLKPTQVSAANYDMQPPSLITVKPAGEYNHARIIVNQGKVEHWLNDAKVVSYELWTPEWKNLVQKSKWKDFPGYGIGKKGHIALQDHGDVVSFRNIKIKEL